jgi:RimJ/RimL family protein N-acetyltransferase
LKPTTETRFERAGGILECSIVPWDSEIFGFPVAQIDHLDFGDAKGPSGVFDAFETWCAQHDVRLVSCRLDHLRLRESMALEDAGFRFVEMVYGLRLDSFDGISPPHRAIQVAEAKAGDLSAIEDIAHSAFTTGRFVLDPRLPPELSQRRYATWVRNSFGSSGQKILKAEVDGDLAGFFIVEKRSGNGVYWHLTAIAPRWQGKGIGASVWRTMLLQHRTAGATSVETTISAHNLPIINLYQRLGFRFASAQMTFHRLREPATVNTP